MNGSRRPMAGFDGFKFEFEFSCNSIEIGQLDRDWTGVTEGKRTKVKRKEASKQGQEWWSEGDMRDRLVWQLFTPSCAIHRPHVLSANTCWHHIWTRNEDSDYHQKQQQLLLLFLLFFSVGPPILRSRASRAAISPGFTVFICAVFPRFHAIARFESIFSNGSLTLPNIRHRIQWKNHCVHPRLSNCERMSVQVIRMKHSK